MTTMLLQDAVVTVAALGALAAVGARLVRASRPDATCGSCPARAGRPGGRGASQTPSGAGPVTIVPLASLRTRTRQP